MDISPGLILFFQKMPEVFLAPADLSLEAVADIYEAQIVMLLATKLFTEGDCRRHD